MNKINLNIHDIARIRIVNPSPSFFKELNFPINYFASGEEKEPDIEVILGNFRGDTKNTVAVDHKYYVKKDYIFFKESVGPLSWKCEVTGLEGDKWRIRLAYGIPNRILLPLALYPDQVLYNYVLYPVLERYLMKKGYLFLHAGAASRDGRASVFAGRGGANKTTIIMNLAKRGFLSMGDGWSILKGNEVFSFPTCLSFFEYRKKNLTHENLSFCHKINLARFLTKTCVKKDGIRDTSRLGSLFIVYREDREDAELNRIGEKEKAVWALFANNKLEWKAILSYKQDASKFFEAYEYVYPAEHSGSDYEKAFMNAADKALEDTTLYTLRIPLEWKTEEMEAIWQETSC